MWAYSEWEWEWEWGIKGGEEAKKKRKKARVRDGDLREPVGSVSVSVVIEGGH